jgi:hypothetical protein
MSAEDIEGWKSRTLGPKSGLKTDLCAFSGSGTANLRESARRLRLVTETSARFKQALSDLVLDMALVLSEIWNSVT